MLDIYEKTEISELAFSNRTYNCLRRTGISTVKDLLEYPRDSFINIKNMGNLSVIEVLGVIEQLENGEAKIIANIDTNGAPKPKDASDTVYLTYNCSVLEDAKIEQSGLSNRAINALRKADIFYQSQLIGLTEARIRSLNSVGLNTVSDIIKKVQNIKILFVPRLDTSDFDYSQATESCPIYDEIKTFYGQFASHILREIIRINSDHPDMDLEAVIWYCYENEDIRKICTDRILELIGKKEKTLSSLFSEIPFHLRNTTIVNEILIALEAERKITVNEEVVKRLYPTFLEYANNNLNDRELETILRRINGETLEDIAISFGITRERIRQIESKAIRRLSKLKSTDNITLNEDKYLYYLENYNIEVNDLSFAFGWDNGCIFYLSHICSINVKERKPINEIFNDPLIDQADKKRIEAAIYRQYISLDGIRVERSRQALVMHYIKTVCTQKTEYSEFVQAYNSWIDNIGLADNEKLHILIPATMANTLSESDTVLWSRGNKFRYYNIFSKDYTSLLSAFELSRYKDVEISALKLFRENFELMEEYDIHDENELHNLLKKIHSKYSILKDITFGKMPTLKIGDTNREKQVYDFLLRYAPISREELAHHYEEEYGFRAATLIGTAFNCLDPYFHQGVYTVDSPKLDDEQFNILKASLTESFYVMSDVMRIYKRELPDSDPKLINPPNLKQLGFKVYSGYIISSAYSSAIEFFEEKLTHDDIVCHEYMSEMTNIGAYSSLLIKLKAERTIIEFKPKQYINIRRLNQSGINISDLEDYCNKVALFVSEGEYFTIESLRKRGFNHSLEEYGFEDWFYSSVLAEDKENFSYRRSGGCRVFRRGRQVVTMGDMIRDIVFRYHKIDFYDLYELLTEHYGLGIETYKLKEFIAESGTYYDSIMDTVYEDYDTYFEEI